MFQLETEEFIKPFVEVGMSLALSVGKLGATMFYTTWAMNLFTVTKRSTEIFCILFLCLILSQNAYGADTTPPVIKITYSPPPIINWTSGNFMFSATDVGTGVKNYKCSLDGATFELCTSMKSYTGLSQGSHIFQFRAFDYAGNIDTVSYTLLVDTTKPTVTLNSQPASNISASTASFGFASADNVGGSGILVNMCKLDGTEAEACGANPKIYTGLGNGSHTFSIYATDRAGNESSLTSYTFTVSLAPPNTRGHYISFGAPTNLKTEMTDILDNPRDHSDYDIGLATTLRDTILAAGVKGIWIPFDWDMIEVGDGDFKWQFFEDNLAVAKRYNKRVIFKFSDRSFNGRDIMPDYFTSAYSIKVDSQRSDDLGGYVSKRWDPYVYKRIIRLFRAIAKRYDSHTNFAGATTTETATGVFNSTTYNYTVASYEDALVEIINQSKSAFVNSKLFMYVNFIKGGVNNDLSKDSRTRVIDRIMATPSPSFALGGPDVMADETGHADSVNLFYIWAEKKYPTLNKACHAQFDDYSQRKSNEFRFVYYDRTGFFPDDILRPIGDGGKDVDLHPNNEIGKFWTPLETFRYAKENFDCNYFFWHYKTWGTAKDATGTIEYKIQDVLPVAKAYPNL